MAEQSIKSKTIAIAGASGDLGLRIARYLLKHGAVVRALIRKGSSLDKLSDMVQDNLSVVHVDYNNHKELVQACEGASCIVSALSGLEDVMIDIQTKLLNAAVEARVQRFIPSDYSIDYTKLPEGQNRNLDFRRAFMNVINQSPIAATSILNGMFTDLLIGPAPVVLFGLKRIAFWGNADQQLDFTTIDNTAAFTAAAALDECTPRFLRIAGEVANPKLLQTIATQVTGKQFKLFRIGGLGAFSVMIKIVKKLFPQKNEVFPPWQGMQYLYDMFTGLPKFEGLDNDRYKDIKWTSIGEVLATRVE